MDVKAQRVRQVVKRCAVQWQAVCVVVVLLGFLYPVSGLAQVKIPLTPKEKRKKFEQ